MLNATLDVVVLAGTGEHLETPGGTARRGDAG
jgi:hypothetical protein